MSKWFNDMSKDILKKRKTEAAMKDTFSNLGSEWTKIVEKAVKQEKTKQTLGTPISDDHPDNTQTNLDTIINEDQSDVTEEVDTGKGVEVSMEKIRVLYEKLLQWLYTLVRIHWHKGRMAWEHAYFRKHYISPTHKDGVIWVSLGLLWKGILFDSTDWYVSNEATNAIITFLDSEIL